MVKPQDLGLTLRFVLNTHCHADHITSGGAIRQRLPVQIVISEASGAKADRHLQHGEVIEVGQLRLDAGKFFMGILGFLWSWAVLAMENALSDFGMIFWYHL
jgi:L-ascorbate metabolism protein UlaG (beta-lactamase superfamily)